ncbi:DUF3883 domain-containing protein [Muribaculum sp.]|uniref:protein NO VEIN domain-containing protein n=1 Tax=Muribaculum sp. TaxID=1918611 RepID=UPI00257F6648|nr:DUF3883 domain-containing protein [Muribaculum sp.]
MTTYYKIPAEFYHRIHFVRPRFKNNIENVLLYMATECCHIKTQSCSGYSKEYVRAIKMFPGNIGLSDKTIANWRTEIPALFGFYEEDKATNITKTSPLAFFLNDNQDLTQFFKFFLQTFQFPGGHLRADENAELISLGIKFKPAKFLLEVLKSGNEQYAAQNIEKEMSISAEEATYCIFNDIRVTTGMITPSEVAKTIIYNRKNGIKYYNSNDPLIFSSKNKPRSKGDVIRYAGDILDYMVIASLLVENHGYFKMKPGEFDTINYFTTDKSWFDGYDNLYGRNFTTQEISTQEIKWYRYVSSSLDANKFKSNLADIIRPGDVVDVIFGDRISWLINNSDRTTKDIGNVGEALIFAHEKMRLKLGGMEDLANKIKIVDTPAYHPGYDIESYEGNDAESPDDADLLRLIEVKTTISKQRIELYSFHMSTHEWIVAKSHRQRYCVYRLMISESSKTLFILRDPVGLDREDFISTIPRDGMDVSFPAEKLRPTNLLEWKN